MPRSSGQNAMPSRAMASDGRPMSSLPSKRIEPCRRATMPMIDLSVVVLPAPLRPSSVTTSPSATSKSMPCRMCDSPYQALIPLTSRRLGMPGSQIGLDHASILRDGVVVPLSEDLAALEYGDPVRKRRHHRQVVLDHQDGAIRGDAPDERRDA